MILGIQPIGNNMPFAELIALYMHILSAVTDIVFAKVFLKFCYSSRLFLLYTTTSRTAIRIIYK